MIHPKILLTCFRARISAYYPKCPVFLPGVTTAARPRARRVKGSIRGEGREAPSSGGRDTTRTEMTTMVVGKEADQCNYHFPPLRPPIIQLKIHYENAKCHESNIRKRCHSSTFYWIRIWIWSIQKAEISGFLDPSVQSFQPL